MFERHRGTENRRRTLRLCGVDDVFRNRIVGDSGYHLKTAILAVQAFKRWGDVTGCVVHADCASKFLAKIFQGVPTRHGLILPTA